MLAAELGVCVLGSQSMSLPSLQESDVQTNEQRVNEISLALHLLCLGT